jgi:hypothetical protein
MRTTVRLRQRGPSRPTAAPASAAPAGAAGRGPRDGSAGRSRTARRAPGRTRDSCGNNSPRRTGLWACAASARACKQSRQAGVGRESANRYFSVTALSHNPRVFRVGGRRERGRRVEDAPKPRFGFRHRRIGAAIATPILHSRDRLLRSTRESVEMDTEAARGEASVRLSRTFLPIPPVPSGCVRRLGSYTGQATNAPGAGTEIRTEDAPITRTSSRLRASFGPGHAPSLPELPPTWAADRRPPLGRRTRTS